LPRTSGLIYLFPLHGKSVIELVFTCRRCRQSNHDSSTLDFSSPNLSASQQTLLEKVPQIKSDAEGEEL